MSKKLKLEDLIIQSFVTSFSEGKKNTVKGGVPGGDTVTVQLNQCKSLSCLTCNYSCPVNCTQECNNTHLCDNGTNNFHCA